jgi:hypothetical protein
MVLAIFWATFSQTHLVGGCRTRPYVWFRVARFYVIQYAKRGTLLPLCKFPNEHKIHAKWPQYIPFGPKIYQHFHFKALQNLPEL